MNKKSWFLALMMMLILMLTACGGEKASVKEEASSETVKEEVKEEQASSDEGKERVIEYLGKEYTIPEKVERIVITGAMEAMEDAVALEVEPVGAVTVAGEFPEIYASVMKNTESIGEKQQPNFEKILELKPDVILGTTKFPEEVVQKLEKIAPTILVSHISTDGEANLHLMAQLSGKTDKAEQLLANYKADIEAAKGTVLENAKDKKVVAVRIRGGQLFIYPEDVFFNAVLYGELGLEAPAEVKQAKSQENISVEQLANMNPDYIFMQVQQSENGENDTAFEDLKKNPIIQNINAFKNEKVFVNAVDSLLEGGPVYSRVQFLEKALGLLDK